MTHSRRYMYNWAGGDNGCFLVSKGGGMWSVNRGEWNEHGARGYCSGNEAELMTFGGGKGAGLHY